jgi:predicted small lipoprotein YifL
MIWYAVSIMTLILTGCGAEPTTVPPDNVVTAPVETEVAFNTAAETKEAVPLPEETEKPVVEAEPVAVPADWQRFSD